MITSKKVGFFPLLIASLIFFPACDNTIAEESGKVAVEMTDAPIDNADVEAVFITVADVKIDGESYAGFEGKQTINVKALQNGKTEALGLAALEAGSYSSLTLVLDYESDEDGNSPGCYTENDQNEKEDLAPAGQTSGSFELVSDFEVTANSTTTLVMDFDLRKAIKQSGSGADRSYSFVSDSELEASLRIVEEDASGTVEGSLSSNLVSTNGKVVVFAYSKGDFDKDTESSPNNNGLRFRNAVTSTAAVRIEDEWEFSLHFLEEGDYEVCYAVYEDEDQDGEATFEGFLQTSLGLNGSVTSDISVSANVSASLGVSIFGLLRL